MGSSGIFWVALGSLKFGASCAVQQLCGWEQKAQCHPEHLTWDATPLSTPVNLHLHTSSYHTT